MEILQSKVEPLNLEQFLDLCENQNNLFDIKIHFDGQILDSTGPIKSGIAKLKNVKFEYTIEVYALVDRGWLPLPLVNPPRFMVDRNILINLNKIKSDAYKGNRDLIKWWLDVFQQGGALFNPLFSVFESMHRRKPSFGEFKLAFENEASELNKLFPYCGVIQYDSDSFQAAYELLTKLDEKYEAETKFLLMVVPKILQRVPNRLAHKLAKDILDIADQYKVSRFSLVVITVLSCIYENIDGSGFLIGRRIIKPNVNYSEGDAHNALSDLRSIEFTAMGNNHFRNQAFAFCTSDRPLVALWSSITFSDFLWGNNGVEYRMSVDSKLLPRLNEEEILGLNLLLQK